MDELVNEYNVVLRHSERLAQNTSALKILWASVASKRMKALCVTLKEILLASDENHLHIKSTITTMRNGVTIADYFDVDTVDYNRNTFDKKGEKTSLEELTASLDTALEINHINGDVPQIAVIFLWSAKHGERISSMRWATAIALGSKYITNTHRAEISKGVALARYMDTDSIRGIKF